MQQAEVAEPIRDLLRHQHQQPVDRALRRRVLGIAERAGDEAAATEARALMQEQIERCTAALERARLE